MGHIVWISDLHFSAQDTIMGLDPREKLRAAIDHINAHYADADLCVISGDMVNRGAVQDYQALADALGKLKMPYLPMVGNHDTRQLFRKFLKLPDAVMSGFVQYFHSTEAADLICLDTLNEGQDSGAFCNERAAWLSQVLSQSTRPTLVFMHHPPRPLGLPMQDTDHNLDGEALLDVLAAHPHVKQLCIGHVHRSISGHLRGIPFATSRSILLQAPPPKPDWDWDSFSPAPEKAQISVIKVSADDVIIQPLDIPDHGQV